MQREPVDWWEHTRRHTHKCTHIHMHARTICKIILSSDLMTQGYRYVLGMRTGVGTGSLGLVFDNGSWFCNRAYLCC